MIEKLSKREKEVFLLIIKGYKNKEISTKLSIKKNTVSTYLKLIYNKTGAKNTLELFKIALKYKIIKN